jgi:hypothetical protein
MSARDRLRASRSRTGFLSEGLEPRTLLSGGLDGVPIPPAVRVDLGPLSNTPALGVTGDPGPMDHGTGPSQRLDLADLGGRLTDQAPWNGPSDRGPSRTAADPRIADIGALPERSVRAWTQNSPATAAATSSLSMASVVAGLLAPGALSPAMPSSASSSAPSVVDPPRGSFGSNPDQGVPGRGFPSMRVALPPLGIGPDSTVGTLLPAVIAANGAAAPSLASEPSAVRPSTGDAPALAPGVAAIVAGTSDPTTVAAATAGSDGSPTVAVWPDGPIRTSADASPLPDGVRHTVARVAAVGAGEEAEPLPLTAVPLPLGVDLLLAPGEGSEAVLPAISIRQLLDGLDDLAPPLDSGLDRAAVMVTSAVLGAAALGASRHWRRRRQLMLAPVRGWQPGSISSFPHV